MTNSEYLIGQAQLKATGATIHDVTGMIGVYRACIDCEERKYANLSKNDIIEVKKNKEALENTLLEFIQTGDIKTAKKNHWGKRVQEINLERKS
jgi:hypothetical protein